MGIERFHWGHFKNVDIFLIIAQKKMKMELLLIEHATFSLKDHL